MEGAIYAWTVGMPLAMVGVCIVICIIGMIGMTVENAIRTLIGKPKAPRKRVDPF